jgi:hypothetical protein
MVVVGLPWIMRSRTPTQNSRRPTPSLRKNPTLNPEDGTSKVPAKGKKADILTDAINYIKQSEREKQILGDDISFLRSRITALEIARLPKWQFN